MEDEMDLRAYIRTLVRHWIWLAGCVLAGALIAGGLSWRTPERYTASASLMTSAATPNIAPLTLSDEILNATIEKLGASLPANLSQPTQLRPLLSASQPAGATIMQLSVTSPEGAQAATIVNAWADVIVRQFQQRQNDSGVLQARRGALLSLLAGVSASQYTLDWALEDARALHERLSKRTASEPASKENELALLELSLRIQEMPEIFLAPASQAPASQASAWLHATASNVQFQVSESSTAMVGDELKRLDDILDALTARRQALTARSEALKNDLAETQARLTAVDSATNVQILQNAGAVGTPASRSLTRSLLLGAVAGFMAGALLVFGRAWWKQTPAVSKA